MKSDGTQVVFNLIIACREVRGLLEQYMERLFPLFIGWSRKLQLKRKKMFTEAKVTKSQVHPFCLTQHELIVKYANFLVTQGTNIASSFFYLSLSYPEQQ